ncbi:hypothetical protein L21TH_1620 [Caldisalinibacter kiritimatiensis]|uniref:Uncharacterized protein n=1 Tax=Caldisalinibacter kiritimatiensis TaxID=1304284 RepID=R1CNP3_9FIRM|nr:hypothetical protein L21TH_1620 [Caldisalinibacter kiritimatiensis]
MLSLKKDNEEKYRININELHLLFNGISIHILAKVMGSKG